MARTIILKEYDYILSNESFYEDLERFVLKNETTQFLKIVHKKGYGKVIQAQNYVGIIQTKDGTTIEILPKISNVKSDEESKKILIKMLKTLKKSPFKHFNTAHLKSSKIPLLEIFITMFLQELSKLVQKGIKSDYITQEENLTFLKGKLKIGEQIKHNSVHKEYFFVEYQEFKSDRVENRLIKTTLEFLYKKSKSNHNQQRIREFMFVFDDILTCNDVKTGFKNIKPSRQMKDYKQVLLWCKIFLFENSFSPYEGNDIAFALLFDMNLLFESYVGHYFKQKGLHVSLQDKTHHLAYENANGKFQLKPDFAINNGEIIADTKWKILSKDKRVDIKDMYQLYAYGTKYKTCQNMYLIYPKNHDITGNSYNYFHPNAKKDLHLDLLFFDITTDKGEFVDIDNIEVQNKYKLYRLINRCHKDTP